MRPLACLAVLLFAATSMAQELRIYDVRDLIESKMQPAETARALLGKEDTLEVRKRMLVVRAPAKTHARLAAALSALRRLAPQPVAVSLKVVAVPASVVARWQHRRRRAQRHGALWSLPLDARSEKALLRRGAVRASPRLVALEGRRAQVAVVEQLSYVSGYEIGRAKGKLAAEPIVDTLQLGWQAEVTAWLSKDRKRVSVFAALTHASARRPFASLATRFGKVQCPQVTTRQHALALDVPDGGARVVFGIPDPEARAPRCPLARLLKVRAQLAVIVRARGVRLGE